MSKLTKLGRVARETKGLVPGIHADPGAAISYKCTVNNVKYTVFTRGTGNIPIGC